MKGTIRAGTISSKVKKLEGITITNTIVLSLAKET